jgi:hypothetical protein
MRITGYSAIVALVLVCAAVGFSAVDPRNGRTGNSILVPSPEQTDVQAALIIPYTPGQGPLAHYAEHLAWLPNIGKNSRPEDRHSNAWTNDYTVGYWISGAPEDLPDMLRKLTAVFAPIDLPREKAETERDIILREYDWWMAGNPDARVAEEMAAFLYEGNAIAASVIGTPEEIRALTYDDARALHAETHRPERARLVVIGDLSERQLARAIEEAGFPLASGGGDFAPPTFALAAPQTRVFRIPDPSAAPRMIWRKVVALPEPVDFDLLEAQTALLRDILDTNLPGGIAGPLRFDAFIAKTFAVGVGPVDERHVEMIFSAEPDAGIGFAALRTAFEDALAASARGIPAATYDRVRSRFEDYWPDWSDEAETARWIAGHTMARVSALRDPRTARELQAIDAQIDPRDIDTLLGALAGPGRTAIALIGTDRTP